MIVLREETDIRRYLELSAEGNVERTLEAVPESVEHVNATRRPSEARLFDAERLALAVLLNPTVGAGDASASLAHRLKPAKVCSSSAAAPRHRRTTLIAASAPIIEKNNSDQRKRSRHPPSGKEISPGSTGE